MPPLERKVLLYSSVRGAAAEPLSPSNLLILQAEDEGREANQEAHAYPPFTLQNPPNPHALAIPPPAGLVTLILYLDSHYLIYLFSYLYFFSYLSFSLVGSNLGTSCSSASPSGHFWTEIRGFISHSVTWCFLLFPSLILQKVALTEVSIEEIWGVRHT